MTHKTKKCCSCHCSNVDYVLSLNSPPFPAFPDAARSWSEAHALRPLTIAFCRHCGLLQACDESRPRADFTEVRASTARADRCYCRGPEQRIWDRVTERLAGDPRVVVNVGVDDLSIRHEFREHGVSVLDATSFLGGPQGLASSMREESPSFFSANGACCLQHEVGDADVIIERQLLERAPDPDDFVEGINLLLKQEGVAVIEVHYIRDMIDKGAFDLLCPEQHCYFSFTALQNLLNRHCLYVSHVERVTSAEGSLRLYVSHEFTIGETARALLCEECSNSLDNIEGYLSFADRARTVRKWLLDLLWGMKSNGRHIVGYGADARALRLLGFLGIGSDLLDCLVDPDPELQGTSLNRAELSIESPALLEASMPDYVLLLYWDRWRQVWENEAKYLHRGGVFVVPLPYPVCRSLHTMNAAS